MRLIAFKAITAIPVDGEGGDVQEGRARSVAPDEEGWHLPLDDARENRPHALHFLPISGDGNIPSVWGASTVLASKGHAL
jgi:hypothetical protein